jgi:ABC-type transport system involved in multi-copper enzyme maturation permease subunit
MTSKAITERPEDHPSPGGDWRAAQEVAPSVVREDEPGLARTLGLVGAFLVILGGMALAFNLSGRLVRVNPTWASFLLLLGLSGLLFHAAFDRDQQIRRIYMAFAYLTLFLGIVLLAASAANRHNPGNLFKLFGLGFLCLTLSLLFLLTFHRQEDDPWFRGLGEYTLGGGGALMALIGLVGANVKVAFLLPFGLLLALLGLVYLAAFIGTRGTSDDRAYRAGWALGGVGLLVFLLALLRSTLPVLFKSIKWDANYYMPGGLLLMGVGLLYAAVSVGLCSDRPLAVLTRRELGAFFYSPMAYFVLLGCSVAAYPSYWLFIQQLLPDPRSTPMIEPIVRNYLVAFFPVVALLFAVPALTMRLLSEEQRSGTLEVLLTAPVDEMSVVLSKFLAVFILYLVMWLPCGLYLLAIPLSGGAPFDYRPLFSFFIGLCVTGAAFVSAGLFFSSLTANQLASGVLTFAFMAALTFAYFVRFLIKSDALREAITNRFSYIDVWAKTLGGRLNPMSLMFFGAMAVMFLFLTVKVLESRRWR